MAEENAIIILKEIDMKEKSNTENVGAKLIDTSKLNENILTGSHAICMLGSERTAQAPSIQIAEALFYCD
jgi:hypothetical protein